MIIKNVLVDWLFVWEMNKDEKFSVCCILGDDHPDLPRVQAALDKAKAAGVAKGLFTEANIKSSAFKHCVRNGTEEFEAEERPSHYNKTSFFNASNAKAQPGIVGPDTQPLMDQGKLYSGCYCNVDVNFYPYNHPKGGKGVGAGFNNIMLVKEGNRLDGRISAEDAFAGLGAEDDLQ